MITAVAAPGPHLALEGLAKRYGEVRAVDALDLAVARGEFVALLGPSGCGKTTTLRMVAGLIAPTGGAIRLDGRDIGALPPYRRNMGLVFQAYALFPHLSVADNVAFGLEMRGVPKPERAARVEEALALVRLAGMGGRRPRTLSGGQQQRVALARALVIRPDLLLLDEPLSNLDAKLRDEMRSEIRDIQRRLGITTLFVTHDQTEALAMADRVAVMDLGRLVQYGTPEDIYERPATPFVAGFVGRINRFEGRLAPDGSGGTIALDHAGAPLRAIAGPGGPPAGKGLLMVRPHRMRIGSPAAGENSVAGVVRHVSYVGDMVQTELDCAGVSVRVEQPTLAAGQTRAEPGATVGIAWAVADTLAFAAEG